MGSSESGADGESRLERVCVEVFGFWKACENRELDVRQ